MKPLILLSAAMLGVSAFPSALESVVEQHFAPILDSRDMPNIEERADSPGVLASKAQTNCGPFPCPIFNEEDQKVSTSGQYAYAAPGPGDIRGPCPGLNAAANHNYIARNGILSIQDTVAGLLAAYNFEPAFAALLAGYSIVMVGDVVKQQWSIGGPPPYVNPGGLLFPPQGISFSHNKYEGDVSIGRNDAFMRNGDAHSLDIARFKRAFETGLADNRYTLHKFRVAFLENLNWSIKNNPYYFSPPFAGAVVPPAAYNFVINFMSNHSAAEPNGYLDKAMFKQFFAVKGKYPNFRWLRGQERIPDNWYRRPTYNQYDAQKTVADDAIGWAAYPQGFRIGGNTNGKNTYQGVNLGDLTGGTFTNGNILKGNNAACLAFQSQQQALPDFLKGGVNSLTDAQALIGPLVAPVITKLGCPQLKKYDATLFNKYPGHSYDPKGPSNNG